MSGNKTPKKRDSLTPPELKGLKGESPAVQNRILEHRLDVQDEKYKNTWKSCCLIMDRRAIQYFTQLGIISSVMAFSIFQLNRLDSCEGQQAYLGLLTLLIGVLIPNPKFNDAVNSA